ncbi:hypothetical protein SAMN04487981_103306 [Streptomyces sp. cf386]|uniref:hypothetical protein n=1 Tax=Streptomyces sp. cf386 TaxID=1761904 RepID=UPI000891EEEF|nr:hypothetical protein [Streptomyces sp. cf386]SDN02746.1 hypothetical protein SAMN04487981_103306 [Streptomyces sp. cf386]
MTDKPSEGSSIPDEEWEKFVRDAERDRASAAPKEPSARARMVTERLRQQDARGELPAGWRTGPAWQEMNGRSPRRRKVWSALGVLLAVAVAVIALKPSAALSLLPGGSDAEVPSASPLAAESTRPSGAPGDAAGQPTRKRPFAGSPAERWSAGADAIEVPKAKAVSGVPAARIEAALRRTKEFLVASNLDRDVLYGAEPKTALALLDPLSKEYVAHLRAGLHRPTVENDPKWNVTRFDPDEIELVGAEVKVRGRMTVEPGEGNGGRALIRADYTFVYPVARAAGGEEVTRTIVRRAVEVEVVDPVRYQATEGRIWLHDLSSEIGNDSCRQGDGFIHPRFQADLYASPEPSGDVVDPYDRSRELDGAAGEKEGTKECGTVSRT